MHTGHYIFTQITVYLPQRQFRRIVKKYPDKTEGWNFIAIIEHDLKLGRPVFEVMRILGSSLLVKDDLLELFRQRQNDMDNSGQMELNLNC